MSPSFRDREKNRANKHDSIESSEANRLFFTSAYQTFSYLAQFIANNSMFSRIPIKNSMTILDTIWIQIENNRVNRLNQINNRNINTEQTDQPCQMIKSPF